MSPAATARAWRAVVWLDRDGTVVDDPGYLAAPAGLRLLPGAATAIARLRAAGAAVVLVTNQSGIARGLMTAADVDAVHAELLGQLAAEGTGLDGIYLCPHLPAELLAPDARPCDCRKPRPGLVHRAAREMGLQGLPAAVVGDKPADVGLARAVGALAVLVRTGEGRRSLQALQDRAPAAGAPAGGALAAGPQPDLVADELLAAVPWLIDRLGLASPPGRC